MKYSILFSISLLALVWACNSPTSNPSQQIRIDSIVEKPAKTYTPGFGEFMSGIQVHHAKLWFAGQQQNWELARFEINEIEEALSSIKEYCTNRPETKAITMIDEPLDSLVKAIQDKDLMKFNSRYVILTNSCNSCHRATDHGFNVIIIPTSPPFSNQDFKPGSIKQ
jgi:hypothetical protein